MTIKKIELQRLLGRVGIKITELVRRDSQKSVWQDNKKGGRYSKQYKFYKSRGMIGVKGKRLKGFSGIHTNRDVSKVNMKLTGAMENNLKVIKRDSSSITMSYNKSDLGKIIGNKKLGRDVVGLNKKNQKTIRDMYEKELIRYFNQI